MLNLNLIKPKEIIIQDDDGNDRTYIISKLPASEGREIMAKYVTSAMPKVGDYATNEAMMLKLMSRVAVPKPDGTFIILINKAVYDNHVDCWETSIKLETAMLEYNCAFFRNGLISNFLDDLAQKLPVWTTKILKGISAQLSPMEKPRSEN